MVNDDVERSEAAGWISVAMLLDDRPSRQKGKADEEENIADIVCTCRFKVQIS